MTHPHSLLVRTLLLAGLLVLPSSVAGYPVPPGVPGDVVLPVPAHRLSVSIRDEGGATLDARVSVTESHGLFLPPADPSVPFHRSYINMSFFYASGEAEVVVPQGPVRLVVSHGPEFTVVDQTLNIEGDRRITVVLRRIMEPSTFGFWGGDTHVHLAHGGSGALFSVDNEDLAMIQRAEGLNVVCALSNGLFFNGGIDPASTPDHLLHFGVEYRSALYGHMGILGLKQLVPYGCCLPGTPAYPTNGTICDLAHAQGATVVSSHPVSTNPSDISNGSAAWPFSGLARELPASAVLGKIDAFDLFSYSNLDRDMARALWFDLLNLGLRIPLSVGTDASVNRVFDPPVGGYRVYANCGQDLSLDGWLAGLRAGKSFATNGPMLVQFLINDVYSPGSTWLRSTHETVTGQIRVLSREPIDRLHIIADGAVLRSFNIPANPGIQDFKFSLTVPAGSQWLVARVTGPSTSPATVGNFLEAVSSPIYIEDSVRSPRIDVAVQRFNQWLVDLKDVVLQRGSWSSLSQMYQVLDELESARQRLLRSRVDIREPDRPHQDPTHSDLPRVRVAQEHSSAVSFRIEGTGSGALEIFDVAGRMVFQGDPQEMPYSATWSGDGRGRDAPAGMYFARVRGSRAIGPSQKFVWLP